MMYQDTFTVPAELRLFIIEKQERRTFMTNWSKYTFVCDPDECDALLEFTARDDYGFPRGSVEMTCPCGRKMVYISYTDAWEPIFPVTKVTPAGLVKINSNPYN